MERHPGCIRYCYYTVFRAPSRRVSPYRHRRFGGRRMVSYLVMSLHSPLTTHPVLVVPVHQYCKRYGTCLSYCSTWYSTSSTMAQDTGVYQYCVLRGHDNWSTGTLQCTPSVRNCNIFKPAFEKILSFYQNIMRFNDKHTHKYSGALWHVCEALTLILVLMCINTTSKQALSRKQRQMWSKEEVGSRVFLSGNQGCPIVLKEDN